MSTENEVKDLNAMSPEQQRIAIAEACGWQCVHGETYPDGNGGFAWDARGMPPFHNLRRVIPDYLNSLDAMHEAEKVLTAKQGRVYHTQLCEVLKIHTGKYPDGVALISAPAPYRAEAFLKTLALP